MPKKLRNFLISFFVVSWLILFNYESLRYSYLCKTFKCELPKVKFLFPPAGWIMFFQVNCYDVKAEVYGQKGNTLELIDPHRIFPIRWIGYDNIRRNILVTVLNPYYGRDFCRYLRKKFPEYEHFAIAQLVYPAPAQYPNRKFRQAVYKC